MRKITDEIVSYKPYTASTHIGKLDIRDAFSRARHAVDLSLWPHTGADVSAPLPPPSVPSAAMNVAEVIRMGAGVVGSAATGYFIGGATKTNWAPVIVGSLVGAIGHVGLIIGGVLGYAGAHYARK